MNFRIWFIQSCFDIFVMLCEMQIQKVSGCNQQIWRIWLFEVSCSSELQGNTITFCWWESWSWDSVCLWGRLFVGPEGCLESYVSEEPLLPVPSHWASFNVFSMILGSAVSFCLPKNILHCICVKYSKSNERILKTNMTLTQKAPVLWVSKVVSYFRTNGGRPST